MARKIRLALISLWLGVMVLFSFIVAPAAFAVLPQPRLAGNVVSRVLGGVEIIGIALGAITILMLIFSRERRSKSFIFELAGLALMTISMFVSRSIVSHRLHDLRLKYGDQLSSLAQNDPIKTSFEQYHQYSVWLMGFNIIAALVLISLLIQRTEKQDV
jgi:Domain of unknown function (DUF4149)